jgi:hypothetical protein
MSSSLTPEWRRVLVSPDHQRHYYVHRDTGQLTLRRYGERAIQVDDDRLAAAHVEFPQEVADALARGAALRDDRLLAVTQTPGA